MPNTYYDVDENDIAWEEAFYEIEPEIYEDDPYTEVVQFEFEDLAE